MFIAMNRFQVKIGSEKAFETIWATRESDLGSMAGFVEFYFLKGRWPTTTRCIRRTRPGSTRRHWRPDPVG